jgi:hypothetical protein
VPILLSQDRGHAAVQGMGAVAIAVALCSSGCSKKYTEIEVRDGGRVGVGFASTRGVEPVLPPDGSQRVVPVPAAPGMVVMRRGREIALGWGDQTPVALVDERGVLPRVPPGAGVEVRGQTLWATYNVSPTRVFPQNVYREDSVPVVLSTEMANVVDAREVKEVRHWPAYVCLPLGAIFTLAGLVLLTTDSSDSGSDTVDTRKIGGAFYIAAAVPLLVYSVINLTSSIEYKPLAIPGAPPR